MVFNLSYLTLWYLTMVTVFRIRYLTTVYNLTQKKIENNKIDKKLKKIGKELNIVY